jgi:hypothetical protein
MAQYEAAKRDLIDWLGLPENSGALSVRRAISTLRADCSADARVREAEEKLRRARSCMEQALNHLPKGELVPAWSGQAA